MPKSHAETLLALVRTAMTRRGWNTAALAEEMKRDRAEVRTLLAGRTPLLVDDFFAMVEALHLNPEELGLQLPASSETDPEPEVPPADPQLGLLPVVEGMESDMEPDPDAPQAEQLFRLGFELGIDMHFVSDTPGLGASGVPANVLSRFPQGFPVKLDAAYHRHNRARYEEEGIELRLSFDRVYTCFFPYRAIRQISFMPAPPPDLPEAPEEAPPTPKGRPTLTLVK